MTEIISSPEQDFIPLKQVLALQSLAMGVFRERARREVSKQKMTGYVLFDKSEGDMGSGATDTYMGVISRKLKYDYWQFTVSFLTYVMREEVRYSNLREQYRFNWHANGMCVGTKIVHDNYYPIIASRVDPQDGIIDTVDPSVTHMWYELDSEDCDDLRGRMLSTVSSVEFNRSE